jgi:hypothetical protein
VDGARSRSDSCGYVGVDVCESVGIIMVVLARCHSHLLLRGFLHGVARKMTPGRMMVLSRDTNHSTVVVTHSLLFAVADSLI